MKHLYREDSDGLMDFRSDTVTKPSAEMRKMMAEAEVGDDVFGGDPTVNRLQDRVAELFGKEAALFCPSGTMANQIVFKTIARPGWELVCERECHIGNYEVAGPAVHSGLLVNFLDTERGFFSGAQIRDSIRYVDEHCPLTKIVALENTHNRHGGTVCPIETIEEISQVCRENDMHFHLDGARIWNAHVASGVSLAEYAKHFDSIAVCLSKGMGVPLGSLTLGTKDFIHQAHRMRKLFGGGMRQVGIIAAGGLYALDHNIARMADDHENARNLAQGLNKLNGVSVDLERLQTNIVLADLDPQVITPQEFMDKALEAGVWCVPFGKTCVRFVTHLDISSDDVSRAVTQLSELSS